MATVSVRELRNDVSAVLRRVEAGETIVVTADRRPVAKLVPIDARPTWIQGHLAKAGILAHQADAGLRDELRSILPDATDDL